jgi:hypothetical protein
VVNHKVQVRRKLRLDEFISISGKEEAGRWNELGVLTWADEIDIAPETLYAEATGSPMPEWMDSQEVASGEQAFEQTPENGAV